MIDIIIHTIIGIAPFVLGGLIIKWAFGGTKAEKKRAEKLFETTAFLHSYDAARNAGPRRFR